MRHINIKMACLIGLLFLAVCMDIKSFKINNRLILVGISIGLAFNLYEVGWFGIIQSISGMMIPIVLLFFLFLFKVLGAGDIKLFSVIGGFFGITFVLQSIVLSFLLAGILSVIHLIKYRQVFDRLQYLVEYIQNIFRNQSVVHKEVGKIQIIPYYDLKRDGYKGVIHFSIAIVLAVLIQVFMQY